MNQSLLNAFMLNEESAPLTVSASDFDGLQFDGYSLQNANIISQEINIFSSPNRELISYKIARNDGGRMNGDYYRERRIRVKGYIKADSSSALETALDTFKRRMSAREASLDLKVNGSIRRIAATLSNSGEMLSARMGYHITVCPFELEFLALDPFFHDLDYSYGTTENNVSLNFSQSIENLGSSYARPVITVIIEAAVSVSGFEFQNTTNNKGMSITTPLVAGDILVINSEESSVTKNGIEVDYDGIFPTLEYGTNDCTFETTGTSVQFTSTVAFKKSYF